MSTKRKRYKPINDLPPEERWDRMTKVNTYADILDLWREFYHNALTTAHEREMIRTLLKQELCGSCDKEKSEEEQLQKMNRLAKALKGNLEK
jgi:hypothetical protein